MTEDRIFEIIARVLNGTATLQDHQELNDWRSLSVENERFLKTLKNFWAQNAQRELTEREKSRIARLRDYVKNTSLQEKNIPSGRLLYRKVFAYAAACLILIGIGYLAGTAIPAMKHQEKTAEIVVSRGSRAQIKLPDGSIVWLGNDSRLSYPEKFIGSTREVRLSGEAYFDVESDSEHPFLVHTSGPTIKVTGTEFYVHDYPDDSVIEASLISGTISLMMNERNLTEMKAGTRVIYSKQTGELTPEKFEAEYYAFWKRGEYVFVDQPFQEIAVMMKRIYNVEIVFTDNKLKERRFTGSLGFDDNIYTLLEIFRRSSSIPFNYSFENNAIYVSAKRK